MRAVLRPLTAAADHDRSIGAIDLARRILPLVKLCTEEGMSDASDEEIEAAYEAVLAERPNGGAAR